MSTIRGAEVLRYTAFSESPDGGNPAGVVLDADALSDADMLAIAAEVGYSETAFLTPPPTRPADGGPADAGRAYAVRYFSPLAEVPFCGHATVAAAVALAERHGPGAMLFTTPVGPVPVTVAGRGGEGGGGGALRATLSSVEPHSEPVAAGDLAEALAALDWAEADLDPVVPPRIAFAGARHLVLAAATRGRLAALTYDFERLKELMLRLDLTTLQLVWRDPADAYTFHVRDPFPVGGVVEDPATGAAAAAFGGYARELGLVPAGSTLTLHQGEDMGRPGVLTVDLRDGDARVYVSGAAARIDRPGRARAPEGRRVEGDPT
ncbi:PhzF family phenazine biosynthesis isomerase [Streptomyces sp. RKND-216]|uniref:PhzF family phenazine biosynthesis protein n=1 Tax=Streptomyces sp. RKND-216 TaxID=2562581 RepID=UPI00109DC170|nr:PhzF family phenazine biosynthesis isomerase [Streptomyces sp. RKND-216]THA26662.1 PhzF family phenazine biosynthesis isomerase [Streptomyces sp. RKND-216]